MVHLWHFVFYLTFDHRWSTSEAILILVKVVISAKSRHFAVLNNEQKTQHEPYPPPPYSQTHKVWGHNSFYIFLLIMSGFSVQVFRSPTLFTHFRWHDFWDMGKMLFWVISAHFGAFFLGKRLRIAINWHSPAYYTIVSLKWGMIWDSFNWWQF